MPVMPCVLWSKREGAGGFEAWDTPEDPDWPFVVQRMANSGIRGNADGISTPEDNAVPAH